MDRCKFTDVHYIRFNSKNCQMNNLFSCCRVAVSRSKDVPPFGPPIPSGAKFGKQKAFANFLLAKGKVNTRGYCMVTWWCNF